MKSFPHLFIKLILCCCILGALNHLQAQITIDIQTNKLTDVAPFKLLVDATGTIDPSIPEEWRFHELHYEWDFGDAGGVWTYSQKDKNIGYGAIYGHVYEFPGTYTVTLRVLNPMTGTETTAQRTIMVTDPNVVFGGTNTICVSTGTDFTGAPAGAELITSTDYTTIINTYAKTGKRILFRRGDEWSVATRPDRIVENGPSLIGAFGTGPKPKFTALAGLSGFLVFSEPRENTTQNWRVMDLELDGDRQGSVSGIGLGGHDMLAYRVDMHHVNGGVNFSTSALNLQWGRGFRPLFHSDLGIVDCTIKYVGKATQGGGVGIFGAAEGILILGNEIYDTTLGEHNLRLTHGEKVAIGHNIISKPAWTKAAITLRSLDWENPGITEGRFSRFLMVSDNVFFADFTTGMANTGTGNNGRDRPKMFDVIMERNVFETDGDVSGPLGIKSFRSTVRNNLFLNHEPISWGFDVGRLVREFTDVVAPKIYNNTFYTQRGTAVVLREDVMEAEVYNNLIIHDPDARALPMIRLAPDIVGNAQVSDNIETLTPGTVSTTYENPEDFALTASSILIDAGRKVPNVLDFYGNPRDPDAIDQGAFEFTGLPYCTALVSPEDEATNVAITETLTWETVDNADGYRISVGTTPMGNEIIEDFDTGSMTSYTPTTPFEEATTIYVTIIPYNSAGAAKGCFQQHFTTVDPTPLEFTFCPEDRLLCFDDTRIPNYTDKVTVNRDVGVTITQDPPFKTPFTENQATVTLTASAEGAEDAICIIELQRQTSGIEVNDDLTIAPGEQVQLLASVAAEDGTGSYAWHPPGAPIVGSPRVPNPIVNPTVTTTYEVRYTNASECRYDAFVTVTVAAPGEDVPLEFAACPEAQEVPCDQTTIPDYIDSVVINQTTDVTLIQNPVAGSAFADEEQEIIITASAPGKEDAVCRFTVRKAAATVEITENEVTIDAGESVTLTAITSGAGTVIWSPATALSDVNSLTPMANPLETTTYTAQYTAEEGCMDEDSITVIVDPVSTPPNPNTPPTQPPALPPGAPPVAETETKFGFSPDGDGINDCWYINGIEAYPDNEVLVYNRWNDLVYEIQGYNNTTNSFCGDANRNESIGGGVLPEGTYFFDIRINGTHTLPETQGFVVLKR